MRVSERQLDEAFVRELRRNPGFVTWLLSKTKFSQRQAVLDADEAWQFRWYRDPTSGAESETDIFLRFEDIFSDRAFALHIENKPLDGRFRISQPQSYRARAEYLKAKLRYDDFQTVLLAPLSFQTANSEDASLFDVQLTYEDLAHFVAEYAMALDIGDDA